MSTYWCELAWLGGDEAEAGVVVETDGDRILGVTTGVSTAPSEARRLEGITIPGLANAHSHAFQRALRGRVQWGQSDFWSWRESMYELAERLDPDRYFALARATFGEMALAGIACVGEFHYLHHGPGGTPYADPNEMGKTLMAAARDAGIRITLLDACYLHGGIGSEPNAVQRRFSDGDPAAWAARVDELEDVPLEARIGAAIHSVRAVDPREAAVVAAWARGQPLHAHVSEQPVENEACLDTYGLTPTEFLADAGVLSGEFTAVHGTHLTPDDVRLLGAAGVTCCLCPTTERDLADGIGPSVALADAGVHLAVGSDSHAVIDIFEEARAIELDKRLETGFRGTHSPAALLRAATTDGHECLGWPEAGRIATGRLADLVTIGLDSVRLAGTDPRTALASVVFGGGAADVRSVIVGGREVVCDGAHVAMDVAAELRDAVEAAWR